MSSLAKKLRFNDNDLAHNQQGRQSPRQRRRNLLRFMWLAPFWLLLTICLFTPMTLALSLPPSPARWGLAAILFFLGFNISLGTYRGWRYALSDWQSGAAGQVTGVLTKRSRRKSSSPRNQSSVRCELMIKDVKIRVPVTVYRAFDNGQRYTVYYLPHAKTLLSATLCAEDDNSSN